MECTCLVINQEQKFYDENPVEKYIIQYQFLIEFLMDLISFS